MADDDILMGTARSADSDGDGVTDAQERLDGTDPDDPNSAVRSVDAELERDPRDGLRPEVGPREDFDKDSIVAPDGMDIERGLTGPDGKAFGGPNHHGVDDKGLFGDHDGGVDPRNLGGLPGQDTGSSTPPGLPDIVGGQDMSLVSAGGLKDYTPPAPPAPPPEKDFVDKAKDWVNDLFKDPPPPPPPPPKGPVYSTNPDADPGTSGPVSEDEVEAAILKQGGDTDFGEGGPRTIDTSGGPPERPNPVADPNPDADDGSSSPVRATEAPRPPVDIAGPEVVRDDLVGGGLAPSAGPGPGTEPNTGSTATTVGRAGGDDDDLEELEVQRNTPPIPAGDDALSADLDADLSVEVDDGFALPDADADAAAAGGEAFGGPLDDGFDG